MLFFLDRSTFSSNSAVTIIGKKKDSRFIDLISLTLLQNLETTDATTDISLCTFSQNNLGLAGVGGAVIVGHRSNITAQQITMFDENSNAAGAALYFIDCRYESVCNSLNNIIDTVTPYYV